MTRVAVWLRGWPHPIVGVLVERTETELRVKGAGLLPTTIQVDHIERLVEFADHTKENHAA